MLQSGVIDPKVVRYAIQDAASIAGKIVTTEAAITVNAGKFEDPKGYASQFPSNWLVTGYAPDARTITFYLKVGQSENAAVKALVAAFREMLDGPILVVAEDHGYRHACQTCEE